MKDTGTPYFKWKTKTDAEFFDSVFSRSSRNIYCSIKEGRYAGRKTINRYFKITKNKIASIYFDGCGYVRIQNMSAVTFMGSYGNKYKRSVMLKKITGIEFNKQLRRAIKIIGI